MGDSRIRGTAYSEKEAEVPARKAVVVRPMVWRRRAELGVRAAIVAIEGILVVRCLLGCCNL